MVSYIITLYTMKIMFLEENKISTTQHICRKNSRNIKHIQALYVLYVCTIINPSPLPFCHLMYDKHGNGVFMFLTT